MRCPGADADSPITWHYKATPDAVAGQIACGTYQGNADIVWTQDDDLLLADVQSGDMDDAARLVAELQLSTRRRCRCYVARNAA